MLKTVASAARDYAAAVSEGGLTMNYLPITGDAAFAEAAARMLLSEELVASLGERRASVHVASGTAALRVGMAYVAAHGATSGRVLLPSPTWGNHAGIAAAVGLEVTNVRYFDRARNGLDVEGWLADVAAAPERSLLLVHGVCHNPTGCDPSADDWARLLEVARRRRHVLLVDVAYQGFGSGSLDADAAATRRLAAAGDVEVLVAQSFSKNMGLYNERLGALHFIGVANGHAAAAATHASTIVRTCYSNPPAHGAFIAKTIMSTS